MSKFEGITDDELLTEIRSRGMVPSVWNVEDVDSLIEEDDAAADLTPEQAKQAAQLFLDRVGSGLEDILGERGNSYLTDRWDEIGAEVISAVTSAPAP